MEPATLTATAIATLAFTKFLEGSAGKAAEKFTEAAMVKMDELRKQIWAMTQNNYGGTNYQTKTGANNQNFFGGSHSHDRK